MTLTINDYVCAYEGDIVRLVRSGDEIELEQVDNFYDIDPHTAFYVAERRETKGGRHVELRLCHLYFFGE